MDEEFLKGFEGKTVVLIHYDEYQNKRNKVGKILKVADGKVTLKFIDGSERLIEFADEDIKEIQLLKRSNDGN